MKVVEIADRFGLDALRFAERPEPRPGPGEVAVRLRAVSLNYRDLLVAKGLYNPRLALPRIPCSDGAGEVTALGPGVTRWQIGDRVAGLFMPRWQAGEVTSEAARSALGGDVDGLLAEQAVLPADAWVRIPEHCSFEEAATLPCAALTAWHALMVGEGAVRPGETVVVQGTGGVSMFALQFARLAGARVIVTSGSEAKLHRAMSLGASAGVNYREQPEWDQRVRQLTDGGADLIVEVGGAGTLERSLKAVRMGGRVALIGVLAGGSGPINLVPILMKGIQVRGIFVGSRTMFEAMNRAIRQHGLRPVIDRVFDWPHALEAFSALEQAAHVGKIVIRVGL